MTKKKMMKNTSEKIHCFIRQLLHLILSIEPQEYEELQLQVLIRENLVCQKHVCKNYVLKKLLSFSHLKEKVIMILTLKRKKL